MNKILCACLIAGIIDGMPDSESEVSSESTFHGVYVNACGDGKVTIRSPNKQSVDTYQTNTIDPDEWEGPFFDSFAPYYIKKEDHEHQVEESEALESILSDKSKFDEIFKLIKSDELKTMPYSSCGKVRVTYAVEGHKRNYVGSGFLINKNIVMTAAHNVLTKNFSAAKPNKNKIRAAHAYFCAKSDDKKDLGNECSHYYIHPEWEKGLDDNYDVALLFFAQAEADKLTLQLAKDQNVKVVGYPKGCDEMRKTEGSDTQYDGAVLKHKADTLPGNSGGPIISAENECVLGVHTRGKSDKEDYNKGVRVKKSILQFIDDSIEKYNQDIAGNDKFKKSYNQDSEIAKAERNKETDMVKSLLANSAGIDLVMRVAKILTKDEVNKLKEQVDHNSDINASGDNPDAKRQRTA
ncbi:trypsin-like serine peptidase [Candidatus Cytomitobacter primus]|uniref:Serine protease n=1 Tax=Candidatus Cytomitobacter primus TaxID=2066024 RepID=A0A5C0UGI9_9PROT|nr:trypsin-like peptidase domain-containing protein [Candidatus Cytomitobacter primus]QEK38673.1 trypsin-like serine protease [Candidatus Cytomitobacter primus]